MCACGIPGRQSRVPVFPATGRVYGWLGLRANKRVNAKKPAAYRPDGPVHPYFEYCAELRPYAKLIGPNNGDFLRRANVDPIFEYPNRSRWGHPVRV